jgi:hypothetical protein
VIVTQVTKRARPAAVIAAGAACALAVAVAAAGPARSATTPGPGARVTVSPATSPAPAPGVRRLGVTAPGTVEHVTFIMKISNLRRLEFHVESGLGSQMSVSQFAGRYGQPAAHVTALRNYLAKYGIASQGYADRLDVSATGTAAQFSAALGTGGADPGRAGLGL